MARKKVDQPTEEAARPELLSLDAAAAALAVSRSTLTRWLSEGHVKGFKVGRQWRFKRADLDRFSQMAHPSAAAVNVSEFEAAIAGLGVPESERVGMTTDPALPNYPNTEEEIAVENLFLALLANAVNAGASDVHFDAAQEGCIIRTRIDGVLHETVRLPRSAHRALVTCAKYHADLTVDQPAVNHDGLFRLQLLGESYHVRVASIPALYGESVAMRVLPQSYQVGNLDSIGMHDDDKSRYLRAVKSPNGLVLVTGPSGSGKTTVMYAGLQRIVKPEIKTFSIEDPVIAVLPWVTQVPVNRKAGMTFEHLQRALTRQDPDVIMVGGVDSLAVAEGCLQHALIGHLVLTTLHANSAASAVTRLLDMGIEPFMLAESLLCIVGARLARKVCPQCAEPDEPAFGVLSPFAERARAGGYVLPDNPKFMRGRGCDHCRGTGHRGRVGLYEVMEMDDDLCRMVMERAPAKALQEAAVKKGMTTLAADGLRKAVEGITSVFEAVRVTHTTEG